MLLKVKDTQSVTWQRKQHMPRWDIIEYITIFTSLTLAKGMIQGTRGSTAAGSLELYGPHLYSHCSRSAKSFLSQELQSTRLGTLLRWPFILSRILHITANNFWLIAIKRTSRLRCNLVLGIWRQFMQKVTYLMAPMLIKRNRIKEQVSEVYSFFFVIGCILKWGETWIYRYLVTRSTGWKRFPLAHLCNGHIW